MTKNNITDNSFRASGGTLLNVHRAVYFFGALFGGLLYLAIWRLDSNGLSMITGTTPYWDFNNLWTGGRLTLEGHVDWIFDMEKYRPAMDNLLGKDVPNQEWSYPPNMLLIGVPLAILPPIFAYLVWTLGSLAMLHFAIRPLKFKPLMHLAVVFSPAIFSNMLFGQNGAFISALLLAGLIQAPKRPIFAGICFGLMTVKPHFGLLIPFVLLASGNWRAIFAATITAVTMAVATGVFFGFSVWTDFLSHTQPMMQTFMEMPFFHEYQLNSVTPFVIARALGANLTLAYVAQACISVAAIACGFWLWRPAKDKAREISHAQKVGLTVVLTMLATPYGYVYDMVAVYAAMAIFMSSYKRLTWQPVFALIWLYPLYYRFLAQKFHMNIGGVVVAVLFVLLFMTWWQNRSNLGGSTVGEPAHQPVG